MVEDVSQALDRMQWRALLPGPSHIAVAPGSRCGAALVRVVAHQWKRIEAIAEHGDAGDPDMVHDLRVACRRCREGLRVFRKAIRPSVEHQAAQALRDLRRLCGPTRELDVALSLLPEEDPAVAWLRQRWQEERLQAAQQLVILLPEHLSRVRSVLSRPLSASADSGPLVKRRARRTLRRLARRIRQTARPPHTLAKLHRLRILCKRLRYAAEMLSQLPADKDSASMTKLIKACRNVQDTLGAGRDYAEAAARSRAQLSLRPDLEELVWSFEKKAQECDEKVPGRIRQVLNSMPV